MKYIVLFLFFTLSLFSQFDDPPIYQPYNLSFENSTIGSVPSQWMLRSKSQEIGFYAEATGDNPFHGKYCMSLEFKKEMEGAEDQNASAIQRVDATPYRGRKVKLSAMIRANIDKEGFAGFYVSERNTSNEYPFVHTGKDNPTKENEWEYKEVILYVTENAYSLNFGLMLQGNGKAWIDYVKIEVLSTEQDFEPTTLLTQPEKNDLLNFAKTYGTIKFFHPSDEVIYLEEDTYLQNSLTELLSATNQIERNKVIKNRIARLAPSSTFYDNKKSAEKHTPKKPKVALNKVAVTNITNNVYQKGGNFNYGTKRWNIYDSKMKREAATYQVIAAKNLRGKKLKFSAKAKVEAFGKDAFAELWFRIDLDSTQSNPINIRFDEEITDNSWKDYSMDVDIPNNAMQIRVGLVFFGEGKVWFDDISIDEKINNSTVSYRPKNFTFNNNWQPNQIEYWRIPNSVIDYGYNFKVDNSSESYDGASLLIYTNKDDYIDLPTEQDKCIIRIKDSMWLNLPSTLYVDSQNTLPKSKYEQEPIITPNPNDVKTKLSVFIEAWNYLRYYSTIKLTNEEWNKLFLDNIGSVAKTESVEDFESIMNEILTITNDVRSDFWKSKSNFDFVPPFIPSFEKNSIIVLKSFNSLIRKNDKILKVDGVDLNEYLRNKSSTLPGPNQNWNLKESYYSYIVGDYKTLINLQLERDGKKIDLEIPRNVTIRELHLLRPLTLDWVTEDIIYLDATRLNDFEFMELMKTFEPAKGMIVDFRGDALLSEHFLGFFHSDNIETYNWNIDIFTSPCKTPKVRKIEGEIRSKQSNLTKNLVLLSDESSVGKSETILRIAKQYNIGTIVGETTVGSYDIMTNVRLPAFYNLSLNIYDMSFKGDNNIRYKQIKPDIEVLGKADYPEDPKIKKAIEILEQ